MENGNGGGVGDVQSLARGPAPVGSYYDRKGVSDGDIFTHLMVEQGHELALTEARSDSSYVIVPVEEFRDTARELCALEAVEDAARALEMAQGGREITRYMGQVWNMLCDALNELDKMRNTGICPCCGQALHIDEPALQVEGRGTGVCGRPGFTVPD